MTPTVSERLVAFTREQIARGVPPEVKHEAVRLLINQLKASVGAGDREAVRILHDWALHDTGGGGGAHVLWLGTETTPDKAAVVNGALFEVLDFHDTYIPTFMHAVSGVLPAVLAMAETGGQSGADVLTALALGLEVELACATLLMPTGYYRGFVPAGLVGAIGAATACSILLGLDETKTRNAIGLAMTSAFGTYETVGSMALSYVTGFVARAGLTAAQLAARGFDAPRTAFEGEKGMLAAYSDEKREKFESVLGTLGEDWRIFGQSYKTVPTETITHAPIECVLALHRRAAGRTLARMRFGVEPIVVKIADERRERFGVPDSELTARFDTRFCAAAAWVRGRFGLAEMQADAYTDPAILDLRDRIDLEPSAMHKTFEGCSLEVAYTDGSTDAIDVPAFRGTPRNRMTDEELSGVFRQAADGVLPPGRADAILDAAWALEGAADINGLMALLRRA